LCFVGKEERRKFVWWQLRGMQKKIAYKIGIFFFFVIIA
jgi:hypothetical protein